MESPAVQKNKTECKMAIRNEEPHVNKCFPRARGDVPVLFQKIGTVTVFSPRTRGCSERAARGRHRPCVFPAHAGMFRFPIDAKYSKTRFPRARGDVPREKQKKDPHQLFSPRTRGCSVLLQ